MRRVSKNSEILKKTSTEKRNARNAQRAENQSHAPK
jgi:hypothetical protein